MTLDDAKASLEALSGVYDVSVFMTVDHHAGDHRAFADHCAFGDATPDFVQLRVQVASPEILPEETRQGIMRIRETLKRELGCPVSFSVSAGLRMPDWASS